MGSWSDKKRAEEKARVEAGMAYARNWRLNIAPQLRLADPVCARCEGHGIVWWCGKPGEGGRRGPCPRCRHTASMAFVRALRYDHFPWERGHAVNRG